MKHLIKSVLYIWHSHNSSYKLLPPTIRGMTCLGTEGSCTHVQCDNPVCMGRKEDCCREQAWTSHMWSCSDTASRTCCCRRPAGKGLAYPGCPLVSRRRTGAGSLSGRWSLCSSGSRRIFHRDCDCREKEEICTKTKDKQIETYICLCLWVWIYVGSFKLHIFVSFSLRAVPSVGAATLVVSSK